MKITLKQSFISFTLFAGLFLFPNLTFATTIYQQLSDASGSRTFSGTGLSSFIGTFTISTTTVIQTGDVALGVVHFNSAASPTSYPTLEIYSGGTNCFNNIGTYYAAYYGDPVGNATTTNEDIFLTYRATPGINTLTPGTYTICPSSVGTMSYDIRTNLSGNFYYGYLTANGSGESVPIAPGLPGFTDVGIATTSQQTYCYSNFSTSTGLLGDLGQSIALGFCNVTVFLFAPNSTSLNNFQSLQPLMLSKVPFSYAYQFYNIYNNDSSTTTTDLPSFSIPFPDIGSSTPLGNIAPTNIVFFSTTTISMYYPDYLRLSFLFLGASAIWIGLGFAIYRRIIPHKVIDSK